MDGSFGPNSRAQCPTLRLGDKNGLVWTLQLPLTVKGYKLELDGIYGPATEAEVKSYEKTVGLKVDRMGERGICGAARVIKRGAGSIFS